MKALLVLFVSCCIVERRMAHAAVAPARCFDVPWNAPPRELVLCGNGVLDPGEICDDGNQVDGDGCSAFCSQFDALTGAATLAGSMSPCPAGRTVLGGTTSNTFFCDLRAIETSLDGTYVLLGDGGSLLRYDLFTDRTQGVIFQLDASIVNPFRAICSIGVLAPDGAIVIHDCGGTNHRFYIAMADGTRVQPLADLGTILVPNPVNSLPLRAPTQNLKSYYNRTARYVVTAGVAPTPPPSASTLVVPTCVLVYGITASPFVRYFVQSTQTLLATLPCTVYGVWENGAQITSFNIRGMEPYLITRERCPPTFRAGLWCYVVYMQRVSHMELLRAYVPEDGGPNVQYYASTQNLFDNALGAPLIRTGGAVSASNALVYTLRGSCLQAENRIVTSGGKIPLPATLGNACRRSPQLGLACATPLNNPFLTDVITSPFLLPNGLSVQHTHSELTSIFGSRCAALANVTSAGPLLYQSVLANVYGNTTPVDFVELAGIMDLVYITPTSVGLISTKRILFQDRTQPGYVRATNMIYCPRDHFGYVGTVCSPCNRTSAPGYYVSIAWQIQCAAAASSSSGDSGTSTATGAAAASGGSPTFETFTVVATRNVTAETLHAGMCLFAEGKGRACVDPSNVNVQPAQSFNLAADTLEASHQSRPGDGGADDLMTCLIRQAEQNTGRVLFRQNPAEYNTRVVSLGHTLLEADAVRRFDITKANFSSEDPSWASSVTSQCASKMARGLGSFLSCFAPVVGGGPLPGFVLANGTSTSSNLTNHSGTTRRRLLQQSTGAVSAGALLPETIREHHAVTLASVTVVSYARVLPPVGNNTGLGGRALDDGARGSGDAFPLWAIVVISVAGVVVLVGLFCVVYGPRRLARTATRASKIKA